LRHLDLSVTVALEDTLNNCSKLLKLRVLNLFRNHYGIHDVDDLNLESLKALLFLRITILFRRRVKEIEQNQPFGKVNTPLEFEVLWRNAVSQNI
jgi:disease resistance protein RPS2